MIFKQCAVVVNLFFWKDSLSYSSHSKGDSSESDIFARQPCNHFCSVFMTPVNQAILCLPFLYGCHFYVKLFQNCRRRRKVTWTFFSFASSFFIVLTKHFNSITQPLFKHQSIASRVCSITPTPYSIYLPSIFSYYACRPLHFSWQIKTYQTFFSPPPA